MYFFLAHPVYTNRVYSLSDFSTLHQLSLKYPAAFQSPSLLNVLPICSRERDKFLANHIAPEPGDEDSEPTAAEEEWVMLEDEDTEAERTAGFLKLQEGDLIAIFNQVSYCRWNVADWCNTTLSYCDIRTLLCVFLNFLLSSADRMRHCLTV